MMRIPAATFVAVVIIATSSSFVDGEQEEGGEGFCQQDRCDASIDDVKSGQDNHDADQAEREKEGASECVHLDIPSMLSAGDWPSIIVIEAKGRLGNHLIAFTLVGALAKQLGFRPFILDDTYGSVSRHRRIRYFFGQPLQRLSLVSCSLSPGSCLPSSPTCPPPCQSCNGASATGNRSPSSRSRETSTN